MRRYPEHSDAQIRRERHGRDFEVPNFSEGVRLLCDPCRVWWNDNFEHPARHLVEPMLFGESVSIPSSQVETVATWIGYQCMVRSVASRDPEFGTFPVDDFRHLRAHGCLPDNHILWVGCRSNLDPIGESKTIVPWSYHPHSPGIFSTLFNLVCRHHLHVPRSTTPWHEGETLGAVLRLWPAPPRHVSWPPVTRLDPAQLLLFKYDKSR